MSIDSELVVRVVCVAGYLSFSFSLAYNDLRPLVSLLVIMFWGQRLQWTQVLRFDSVQGMNTSSVHTTADLSASTIGSTDDLRGRAVCPRFLCRTESCGIILSQPARGRPGQN